MDSGDKIGVFGLGLLVGAAIGVAVGILYAPRSGEETRKSIQVKALDAREKASQMVKQAKTKLENIASKEEEA